VLEKDIAVYYFDPDTRDTQEITRSKRPQSAREQLGRSDRFCQSDWRCDREANEWRGMTFAQALESCPRLKPHAREGLRALGNNRSRVTTTHTRLIRGSIDVEAAQRAISGQYTWDYGIGFAAESGELAIWVEVHPANSLHVGIILDKLQSLLEFLTEHAPGMRRLPPRYVWLAMPPKVWASRRIAGNAAG